MQLRDLPIGARIWDCGNNRTSFIIAAHDHPDYGGTTLITDCVVSELCYDAAEKNSPLDKGQLNTKESGNNNYAQSNLHQWLNASGTDWYKPQHDTDEPPLKDNIKYGENPYTDRPGFLTGFSDTFMSNLEEVDVPYFKKLPDGGGEAAKLRARVFIPSAAEIGMPEDDDPYEGERFPVFDDFRANLCVLTEDVINQADWKPLHHFVAFIPGGVFWYWLRTPHEYNSYLVRYYSTRGQTSYTFAKNGRLGVRCVLNLNGETPVMDKTDSFGAYRIYDGRGESI